MPAMQEGSKQNEQTEVANDDAVRQPARTNDAPWCVTLPLLGTWVFSKLLLALCVLPYSLLA